MLVFFCGCQQSSLSGKGGVVSLSPSTSEILGLYFTEVKISGRTSACNYPKAVTNAPIVCSVKPDFEGIAQLKPKHILLEKQLFSIKDLNGLKPIAPVFIFDSSCFKNYIYSLEELPSIVGPADKMMPSVPGQSTNLAAYIERLKGLMIPRKSKKGLKVGVILDMGSQSNYFFAGTKSFLGEIIRVLGYETIGPNSMKFESIDIESILNWKLDYAVTTNDSKFLEKDPRLKIKKIIKVEKDLLLRMGGRVDLLIQKLEQSLKEF